MKLANRRLGCKLPPAGRSMFHCTGFSERVPRLLRCELLNASFPKICISCHRQLPLLSGETQEVGVVHVKVTGGLRGRAAAVSPKEFQHQRQLFHLAALLTLQLAGANCIRPASRTRQKVHGNARNPETSRFELVRGQEKRKRRTVSSRTTDLAQAC